MKAAYSALPNCGLKPGPAGMYRCARKSFRSDSRTNLRLFIWMYGRPPLFKRRSIVFRCIGNILSSWLMLSSLSDFCSLWLFSDKENLAHISTVADIPGRLRTSFILMQARSLRVTVLLWILHEALLLSSRAQVSLRSLPCVNSACQADAQHRAILHLVLNNNTSNDYLSLNHRMGWALREADILLDTEMTA